MATAALILRQSHLTANLGFKTGPKMHQGICVAPLKGATGQWHISALILPLMAISQGIEEEDISFARELFPKTRQHGLALGIHQRNDEEGDLEEEEDDGDAEKEDKVRMMRSRQDGKEIKRQEQEEEMSDRESDLSSASESVSLEVGQSLDFRSLDSLSLSLSHQHFLRCQALAGMTGPPIFPPASGQVL